MVYVPQVYIPGQQQQQQGSSNNNNNHNANNRPQQGHQTYQRPPATAPHGSYAPQPATVVPGTYVGTHYTPGQGAVGAGTQGAVASSSYPQATNVISSSMTHQNVPSAPAPPVKDALPDFAQALDNPTPPQTIHKTPAAPPVATATAYTAPVKRRENDIAVYDGTGGYDNQHNAVSSTSTFNAATYSGGPTHGLVSEGNPVKCHKVDYEIKGQEMQLVEIELDPQETVIAEAGGMMFVEDNIDFKVKLGDGSTPGQGFFGKLFSAGGRLLTGESLFLTHFTNKGHGKARVAFAAPYPGTIIPVNMATVGEKLICQKDAFLCAAKGTKLSIHFNKRIGSGLFGGEGFILQRLEGDGMAFIHAGGTVIRRELNGERIRLDTGCLVAFTDGIKFDITLVPGLKSILFGGEGLFLATLQGHGTVWMQSLPFSRMADRILQHAPSAGGRRQGEGSLLTGQLGDVLNGDGFGFNF